MPDLDRRALLGSAAASAGAITSPRIERLRVLFARLDALPENYTDADMNRLCHEILAISDAILASPAAGLVGLVEYAMAAHYWFRPNGSASGPGVDVACVQALVGAVLAMSGDGA